MARVVIIFVFITLFLPGQPYAENMPSHAHKNIFGTGWECDRGYYRNGNKCERVVIPENAHLNIFGNGWECNRGYYRSGNSCEKVVLPANAHINLYGNGWECDRGYYRSGQQCKKVIVPEHAHINIYGNGWECDRGYYRSGQECKEVVVPEHAHINLIGNGWECDRGYKKVYNACIPMTKKELQKQKELEQAILMEIQRRKLQGVTGDDCETEYKTNAEVCVEITGVDIDCNEGFAGKYYNDCDVTVSYDIETDYRGGSYLDVEVECRVEIEYKGRGTYITQSDSSYRDESYTLYAYGSESDSMSFNFSFSSFSEIISVKISSASCEIESVELQ